MKKTLLAFLAAAIVLLAASTGFLSRPAFADEGMWTFDNPPLKILKEKYGFTPTQEWLDHIRLASVRFMDGGSGSFISSRGLILTNHHVAMGQLQKMSSAEKNYVADGFTAATTAEEIKCPDLEVNVLVSMEDVTARVKAAVAPGLSDAEALKARRAATAAIEKESLEKTGLRSNVVDLYHGGEYWLYRYKKYTDVRLVMAPERQAAYFGGDSDNFTYPRYDLDMAFFRAYENGEPVASSHYLKWNPRGLAEDDLVFVSGNPGSTDRLYTAAQLEYQRDAGYPLILKYIDRYLDMLRAYAQGGPEQQRRALGRIFGLENAKKALSGEYRGLMDEAVMAGHKKAEEEFRALVKSDPELEKAYGDGWETVARAVALDARDAEKRFHRQLTGSQLAGMAGTIVRYVAEVKKPDGDRLPGFHDSELEELRFNLLSPAPIYKDLEEWLLGSWMEWSLEVLGPEDPFMTLLLAGETPRDLAKKLIAGTRLEDVKFRKSLLDGGERAVRNCKDPLIVLLRRLDPMLRDAETWRRENVESALTAGGEKIAQARFAVYGKKTYPDATFTLRLSYGMAAGYPMNGTRAPYMTTLYGLYDRALGFGEKGAYALPRRFWERKAALDLSTPVNFVSTCDIIGGNSGSPVVNRAGELVGLIFDGNIESLVGRFVYDDTANRAVSVHCAFMLEALRKLYDAAPLADEIMPGSSK
ncbi:MAG: S46 family peptidase [Candidatus Aminicenantes bacterium]|nr:S46 family peptidase [Candidatus Aminicenantes bacterium]